MIGCDGLNVHIQRVYVAHAEYLGLLDEPSMYIHGLGTTETERLNTSHMDDMINMLMFTIEATSSHVMIGFGIVDLDRVPLNNYEGCCIKWEFISN